MRRDHHRVNIFSFQQFAVIVVRRHVAGADFLFGNLVALFIKIANRGLRDVVLRRMAFLAVHVGQPHARTVRRRTANADVTDRNPVIGSDDASRGRRRVLAIDWGLERIRGGHQRGRCGGLFQEIPACLRAGRGRFVVLVHKNFLLLWLMKYGFRLPQFMRRSTPNMVESRIAFLNRTAQIPVAFGP